MYLSFVYAWCNCTNNFHGEPNRLILPSLPSLRSLEEWHVFHFFLPGLEETTDSTRKCKCSNSSRVGKKGTPPHSDFGQWSDQTIRAKVQRSSASDRSANEKNVDDRTDHRFGGCVPSGRGFPELRGKRWYQRTRPSGQYYICNCCRVDCTRGEEAEREGENEQECVQTL